LNSSLSNPLSHSVSCALCGESRTVGIHRRADLLYGTTDELFTIARCVGCGLVRLDPQPSDLARFYPAAYWLEPTPLEDAYRRLVLRDHLRFVKRALGTGQCVLDVGCGSGLFLRELLAARPGLKAVGLDNSSQAVTTARRRYGIRVIAADLLHSPFSDGSFDLITMFHVLEHLSDPAAYLAAAHRLLAAEGKLVLQTPNLDCWQYRLFGSRWSGLDVPRHLYDFRAEDLCRLLENNGFRIVRVKHFSWRDNPAGLATTIAPHLEPVARAARGAMARNSLCHSLYLALTIASFPFAVIEAWFGHGSSVMIEAEPA
jgi:SAM-dependent methyltransferase